MKTVFTRQSEKGKLTCKADADRCYFYLDGTEIRQMGMADIETVESLKDKKFAKNLYDRLVASGAVAVWSYQVALYGDEPQQIADAVAAAKAEQDAEERKIIADSDIRITDYTATGMPAKAENDRFSWFWGEDDFLLDKKVGKAVFQMAWMRTETFGSDKITDEADIAAVRKFWKELRLIKKYAELEYESKKEVEREEWDKGFYDRNPHLKGLSYAELKRKEKEYVGIDKS